MQILLQSSGRILFVRMSRQMFGRHRIVKFALWLKLNFKRSSQPPVALHWPLDNINLLVFASRWSFQNIMTWSNDSMLLRHGILLFCSTLFGRMPLITEPSASTYFSWDWLSQCCSFHAILTDIAINPRVPCAPSQVT